MATNWPETKRPKDGVMSENTTGARVACVVPYVGAWPHYSDLFFDSCRFNPNLDILLVSPTPPASNLPPNVRAVPMSVQEIVRRLEVAVGFSLGSFRWHKLCDFRPFFGLAFADLLKPYEFWGYCDVDVMFGDLSSVLQAERLDSIDAFSAHSRQFVGHFTLLRNREDINRLGFEIPDWKALCLTEKAEHLDEESLHDVFRAHPELRLDVPEDLDRELEKQFCRHAITYTFFGRVADLIVAPDVVVTRWQDGKVFAMRPGGRESEVLYVHFMALKHGWHWPRNKNLTSAAAHYFSRVGYGRAVLPEDLCGWRNRWLYRIQCLLLNTKKTAGGLAHALFPADFLRRMRRAMRT
jgi:hypothetical protein